MNILCLDPGNHTGWCLYNDSNGSIIGGTIMEQDTWRYLYVLFTELQPDMVVIESFNLYPGMAQHMAWNSFYPVEVIGAVHYLCHRYGIPYVMQKPSVKKYAGKLKPELVEAIKEHSSLVVKVMPGAEPFMEHTKDAILHLQYYLRNSSRVTVTPKAFGE